MNNANNMSLFDSVEKSIAICLAGYRQLTGGSIQESLDLGDQVMARLRQSYVQTGVAYPNQNTGVDPFMAASIGNYIANNPDVEMRSDSGSQQDNRGPGTVPRNQIIFDDTISMAPGTNTPGVHDWFCNVLGCGGAFTRNRTRQDHFEKVHGLNRDGTIKTTVSDLFEEESEGNE